MTPMMMQYFEIKDQYPGYILFYRLGDFYEMFFEDAQLVSAELELTLTGRDCGEEERAPMCGVPYHSSDKYIAQLIEKGYKVAICEQTEDPKSTKNLVKREVVRIITPGTVTESEMLTDENNNYLCTLYYDRDTVGLCFADISTAYICATTVSLQGNDPEEEILSEIMTYSPSEILTNVSLKTLPKVSAALAQKTGISLAEGVSKYFDEEDALKRTDTQFGPEITDGKPRSAKAAVGAALWYIAETQMQDISYIKNLNIYDTNQYLEMDSATRRNLELTQTMLSKKKRGSLLWVLDKTESAMGARMLKNWIEHPLTDAAQIIERQQAVDVLNSNFMLREEIREMMKSVLDVERLITRVIYGTAGARDLRSIAQTLQILPGMRRLLENSPTDQLNSIYRDLDELTDIYSLIDNAIVENPPFIVREGGLIKDGYNEDVDKLRYIMTNGKDWIKETEAAEKEKLGVKNLKIGYNRVFGYFIEVPRSAADMVPDTYIRKQTLSDKERYITDDLKDMEATILGAEDKVWNLEYEIFAGIRDTVAKESARIRKTAAALARLDVYVSLAEAASLYNYVCPDVDYSDEIRITEGRHPVVEQFVKDSYFVPNDTCLDTGENALMMITGPNMAGKSTYMRQTALIVLMAQIGSFVPASYAHIGIVDRLFTRVGASDDLASGQSTFMLEMKEVAYILNNATRRSFIIYDEIGRGTSTYDGMSIARAVAEYTVSRKIGAKTMFATHYHELTAMENELPGVVNYHVAAKKRGDDITFLRKIVKGPTDDSYGIEVAKLAGVPAEVTRRAKEILKDLEKNGKGSVPVHVQKNTDDNLTFMDMAADSIKDKLMQLDVNTLTPIEALNILYEWKTLI